MLEKCQTYLLERENSWSEGSQWKRRRNCGGQPESSLKQEHDLDAVRVAGGVWLVSRNSQALSQVTISWELASDITKLLFKKAQELEASQLLANLGPWSLPNTGPSGATQLSPEVCAFQEPCWPWRSWLLPVQESSGGSQG